MVERNDRKRKMYFVNRRIAGPGGRMEINVGFISVFDSLTTNTKKTNKKTKQSTAVFFYDFVMSINTAICLKVDAVYRSKISCH